MRKAKKTTKRKLNKVKPSDKPKPPMVYCGLVALGPLHYYVQENPSQENGWIPKNEIMVNGIRYKLLDFQWVYDIDGNNDIEQSLHITRAILEG